MSASTVNSWQGNFRPAGLTAFAGLEKIIGHNVDTINIIHHCTLDISAHSSCKPDFNIDQCKEAAKANVALTVKKHQNTGWSSLHLSASAPSEVVGRWSSVGWARVGPLTVRWVGPNGATIGPVQDHFGEKTGGAVVVVKKRTGFILSES